MCRRGKGLAAICLGVVLTAACCLESFRLSRSVLLQLQGKCDWLPCADEGTNIALGLFLTLSVVGMFGLALVVRRLKADW